MSDFYDSATGKAALATDDLGFIAEGSSAKELFDLSKLTTKTIVQNGTYKAADDNADGFSEVTVNIPSPHPTLIGKIITQNGTYDASDDEADGYYQVQVDIQPAVVELTADDLYDYGVYMFTGTKNSRTVTYITGTVGIGESTDTLVISYPEGVTVPTSTGKYCVVYDSSVAAKVGTVTVDTTERTITIVLSAAFEADTLCFISISFT